MTRSLRSMRVAVAPPTCASMPVPAVAVRSEERRFSTSSRVPAASGPVEGITWYTTALVLFASLGMGPNEYCTSATVSGDASAPTAFDTGASVVIACENGCASGRVATTRSGPLTPGPKAASTCSKATRCDRAGSSEESSGIPKSMCRNGQAIRSSSAVPSVSASHGRRPIRLAKRPQNDSVGSAPFFSFAKGRRMRSILLPANPSRQGSSVVAARIITATPMAAETPSVRTSGIGTNRSPRSAMHTVSPANTAALPADASANPTASSGSRPSAMYWR